MRDFLPLLLAGFFTLSPAFGDPVISDAERYGADFFHTFSEKPIELPAGSELRHELFDSIRKNIPPDHKFDGSLEVFRNWAFFNGKTVDAQGKTFYFPETGFCAVAAIWLRTRDGRKNVWKLVDSSFGAATDQPYLRWPYQYGAPYVLFGMDPALGQSGANMGP